MPDPDLESILRAALEDERKAEATYATVIERFGHVRPFVNIIQAERRHSKAIEQQMQRLGLDVPENHNNWGQKGEVPATLAAACRLAIEAELENIALYDRLIPRISDSGARSVLGNLRDASRDNHLPAFRRCLDRQGGGAGRGRA